MKKALFSACAAVAAVALTPAANAATIIPCPGSASPVAVCTFIESFQTGGFSNSFGAGQSFDNYFAFQLTSSYSLSITSTKTIQVGGPIALTTSQLVKITPGPTVTNIGAIVLSGVANDFLVGPGLYALHFVGSTTGTSSLSGTIDVAPVPEPATWALMIAGIATVGIAMRRRASKTQLSFS